MTLVITLMRSADMAGDFRRKARANTYDSRRMKYDTQ